MRGTTGLNELIIHLGTHEIQDRKFSIVLTGLVLATNVPVRKVCHSPKYFQEQSINV